MLKLRGPLKNNKLNWIYCYSRWSEWQKIEQNYAEERDPNNNKLKIDSFFEIVGDKQLIALLRLLLQQK